jgi:murein DD-endopeptidase MepM/ murein hydrolase activator NlpD
MKKAFLILVLVLFGANLYAQSPVRIPDGGGDFRSVMKFDDELKPEQRQQIIQKLKANETELRQRGLLPNSNPLSPETVAFIWPIKQGLNYNDPGYYGISNYIDQDDNYPNIIQDYNCGTRSYDLSSGYNHAGTDIFSWPYPWQKMARNSVEIIAGAAGTIIGKDDGNFDQNCSFCSGCNWNAVYIVHSDGSVAWYGHLKSGSLTTKTVGQTVAAGEYLGVMGSSGVSTGPHLHLEIYTDNTYTQLVDPWAGPCNYLNGSTSWWANQQPYYVSTLNKVMTHGAAPGMSGCPGGEIVNEKINFAGGETIYLGGYYRDQQNGQQSVHTIYRPDGSVYSTWTQNFNIYYSASWWWYSLVLPAGGPAGTWRYEIFYNGSQRVSTYFALNAANVVVCPNNDNLLVSNLAGSVSYQWQVNTGSGFANISNGLYYSGVTARTLQLKNIPSSFYGYQYRCVVDGSSFSHNIGLKFESLWRGTVNNAWENPTNWGCGNIPDANTDVVIPSNAVTPEVSSMAVCRSLKLNPGAQVTIKTGWDLKVVK